MIESYDVDLNDEVRRREWDDLLTFYNIADSLLALIECIEIEVVQRRVSRIHEFVVRLHKEAKSGLTISNHLTLHLAEHNKLPPRYVFHEGSTFNLSQFVPSRKQTVIPWSSPGTLPEYIFIGRMVYGREQYHDEGLRHYIHSLAFIRCFMELLVISSRLLCQYDASGVFTTALIRRLVDNRPSLQRVKKLDLTIQQLIEDERKREEALKTYALEQDEVLGDVTVQAEDADLLSFLKFISELERDYHRRDVFLAIATLNYFNTADRPSFNGFWEWGEKHLATTPYKTMILGHPVQIAFIYGVIKHRGILEDPKKDNELKKISCQKNCYKNIHPLAAKIKAFLQEKNIRNIPSIP